MVSASVTSVLLLHSDGARANFVVWVVMCGVDDLLHSEICGEWTGDISEDAEGVDVRLTVISPSVMPIAGDVGVIGGGFEAAVRTTVRRLNGRFPKPVR